MRILLLNERDCAHPAAGGAEVHLREVFGRLARQGSKVTQVSGGFGEAPPEECRDGYLVRRLAPTPWYYLAAARHCRRTSRKGDFQVVVECLNKLPFYSPLYSAVPVVALCHHLFGTTAFRQLPWPLAAAVWLSERLVPTLYRRLPFIAISESSRQDLLDRGVPAGQIHLIPCGVEPPTVAADVERPRPPRIAYLGRLEPYKRVDVLLRAMVQVLAAIPAAELHLVGRGSAGRSLQRLARRLELEGRVFFHGFLDDNDRDRILLSTRVAACPSAKEGWGLTVLECNALGVPVVASDVPGLRDSVRHGQTGLLVPFADSAELARRLIEVLIDDDLARRLAREAVAWSRRFDWDRAARETSALLESVVEAGRRSPSVEAARS